MAIWYEVRESNEVEVLKEYLKDLPKDFLNLVGKARILDNERIHLSMKIPASETLFLLKWDQSFGQLIECMIVPTKKGKNSSFFYFEMPNGMKLQIRCEGVKSALQLTYEHKEDLA